MSFFEKIKKSVSGVSVDRVSQIENEKVSAGVPVVEPAKAPLSASILKSDDTKPIERNRNAAAAVSGDMGEAECMRVIPMLCQKADECPELQAEISAIIDEFLELERAGDESALLERLKQAESRYRA